MPDRRIVLQPIDVAEVSDRATVGGGPFVTGADPIPDVTLVCGSCYMTAIIVPITAIDSESSDKLGFRCNACGKYGVLPPGARDAIE